MKKIRMLIIVMEGKIRAAELPAFRSAIIEKAGREHILFHNHLGEKGFVYSYPQIQYKTVYGGHPAIQCIDTGVDEIHHFFEKKDWTLYINGNHFPVAVKHLKLFPFTFQVWDHTFNYRIVNWLALNQENYKKYISLGEENKRISLLNSILKSNILAMAKSLDWHIDKEISLDITELEKSAITKFKEQHLMVFTLAFRCNVGLPDFIGLGKGVSIGFGMVLPLRNAKKEIEKNDQ